MDTLLFVYGTLKRGCSNHAYLADQTFLSLARTPPGYRLYNLGGYPGLVPFAEDRDGVVGELWSVNPEGLVRLDRFEGVHEGLYRREVIALLPPHAEKRVHAYFPGISPVGKPDLGSEWIE